MCRRSRIGFQAAVKELVEGAVFGDVGFEEGRGIDLVGLDEGLDVREGVGGRVERDPLLDALVLRANEFTTSSETVSCSGPLRGEQAPHDDDDERVGAP